ncbi:hypothetical protein ACJRO7_021679 [Eucalyptus globulus]|uniref:LysM domain-containing protein n=1 Tax=Eucalyptus globulus TaxID=34317 RepID=A0ABD3KM27_EUCGL
MANITKSAVIFFFQILLRLSLLLAVSMAENKLIEGVGILGEKDSKLECATAYGVRGGDNCTSVAETFSLSPGIFADINPNVDCNDLLLGQWLCVQ